MCDRMTSTSAVADYDTDQSICNAPCKARSWSEAEGLGEELMIQVACRRVGRVPKKLLGNGNLSRCRGANFRTRRRRLSKHGRWKQL